MERRAGRVDLARVHRDERQDIGILASEWGPHLLRKEVARHQCVDMSLDEMIPAGAPALGSARQPASSRILRIVVREIAVIPGFFNSANKREYPRLFSRARRSRRIRISSGVRGRPRVFRRVGGRASSSHLACQGQRGTARIRSQRRRSLAKGYAVSAGFRSVAIAHWTGRSGGRSSLGGLISSW